MSYSLLGREDRIQRFFWLVSYTSTSGFWTHDPVLHLQDMQWEEVPIKLKLIGNP